MIKSWILASGSPRRREILQNLGVRFEVFVTDTDENTDEKDPGKLAEELSARKGRAALAALRKKGLLRQNQLLIASDTTVSIDGEILGKPADAEDAARMLRKLSGRTHRVESGLFLSMDGKEILAHEVTEVDFLPMSEEEIAGYIATGEPFGKAGAYAVQGIGSRWIRGIRGDYFNVVGLPVRLLWEKLREGFGEEIFPYVGQK